MSKFTFILSLLYGHCIKSVHASTAGILRVGDGVKMLLTINKYLFSTYFFIAQFCVMPYRHRNKQTHTLSLSLTHGQKHTHTHTLSFSLSHTHRNTHTHTHSLSLSKTHTDNKLRPSAWIKESSLLSKFRTYTNNQSSLAQGQQSYLSFALKWAMKKN